MLNENECERIQSIKYGIIAQIFNAGVVWNTRYFKGMDNEGKIPPELNEELQNYLTNILDTYYNVIDQVWEDSCDCEEEDDELLVCDECKKKLDEDFKKEFQDKK